MTATADLNGKRVLVVEGHTLEHRQDFHDILVDAGGDGRIVQEIYFQASEALYPRHFPEAKRAMDSIVWK